MSEHCSTCGVVTRGGACSEYDSRRERLEQESRCGNLSQEGQQAAREEYVRRYLA